MDMENGIPNYTFNPLVDDIGIQNIDNVNVDPNQHQVNKNDADIQNTNGVDHYKQQNINNSLRNYLI